MQQGWRAVTDSLEHRLAAVEAELGAARAEMQEFTSRVSHDLRAPLRHIVSFAQLVQDEAGPQLGAEVAGFLSTITDSARHMGAMLDSLAALSRVGTLPLQLGPVPLEVMVRRLSAELHQLHPQRTIEWRIANDLPVVLADEALLAQALHQVLDNAVKFTAKRPLAAIDVRAHCAEADGFTVLEVRDNGVGFNLALQSKLFQAFGRLHSATEFAGLGMGLALARKLVERLGGTITAQSEAGAGCCVRLQLPDFTQ